MMRKTKFTQLSECFMAVYLLLPALWWPFDIAKSPAMGLLARRLAAPASRPRQQDFQRQRSGSEPPRGNPPYRLRGAITGYHWVISHVPMFHITQPLGIWSIMATIRWCPIFPKWDIYQPLGITGYHWEHPGSCVNDWNGHWAKRPSTPELRRRSCQSNQWCHKSKKRQICKANKWQVSSSSESVKLFPAAASTSRMLQADIWIGHAELAWHRHYFHQLVDGHSPCTIFVKDLSSVKLA